MAIIAVLLDILEIWAQMLLSNWPICVRLNDELNPSCYSNRRWVSGVTQGWRTPENQNQVWQGVESQLRWRFTKVIIKFSAHPAISWQLTHNCLLIMVQIHHPFSTKDQASNFNCPFPIKRLRKRYMLSSSIMVKLLISNCWCNKHHTIKLW